MNWPSSPARQAGLVERAALVFDAQVGSSSGARTYAQPERTDEPRSWSARTMVKKLLFDARGRATVSAGQVAIVALFPDRGLP